MKHIKEFDRFAHDYCRYKLIQSRVAKHLVSNITYKGRNILDLGAGSGAIYHNIDWPFENFIAVDASKEMLSFHPSCTKIVCDFDSPICFEKIKDLNIDQVIAASSLQWSRNLDQLLKNIAQITPNVAFALFTSNTFKTIHTLAGIDSPIYGKEEIEETIKKYFSVFFEVREYKLFFDTSLDMFRYIKRSGVSQGRRMLSYMETKELIKNYPLSYLEFEVVYAWSK